ncbi:MAG: hypothetical protein WC379_16145 [Methanoregula sp.]|jgi:hypothetical protein
MEWWLCPAGLLRVRGVQMPANQFGSTLSRKNPQYRKRSPMRTGITRFMLMRCPRLQRMTWHWTREHEEHERKDEAVVPVPESGIIFPERIDPGKKPEQRHESNRDERDKADACRFSHGAVRHTRGIPVRDHLVGEHRVHGERDEEGEDEAGDDCDLEGVCAGRWVLVGNEEWGWSGGGICGRAFWFWEISVRLWVAAGMWQEAVGDRNLMYVQSESRLPR